MKIHKTKNKITFTFDRFNKRFNPYMVDDKGEPLDIGEYPAFTGLIIRHRKDGNNYDEIGFASTIDMSYKDKSDQVGDFIVMWHDGEEKFIKECNRLKISIHYLDL